MTLLLPATASVGRWNLDSVYHVDALALLAGLPDASVDAFILDLPYAVTQCSWDQIIPFEPMWQGVRRVLKPRGVFVTTASQPFTSKLVMSNLDWFHDELVWEKQHPKGFLNANRKHLKSHENIIVFCDGLPHYEPQGTMAVSVNSGRKNKAGRGVYNQVSSADYTQTVGNYPRSVLRFDAVVNGSVHPTQKPVALFRYLIRTYTQPGDLVVDFCCGSGTTALAAREEGRRFIVGDTSPDYVAIARNRLAQPYTPSFMNLLDAADSATADDAETRVA